jgi:hypothetical protein
MPNALQGLLSQLASIVAGLSPVAKTVVAAVLPLASALLNMALAGSFNTTSIVVLVTGAIAALAVYVVPNKAKAAPAPAPVPGK